MAAEAARLGGEGCDLRPDNPEGVRVTRLRSIADNGGQTLENRTKRPDNPDKNDSMNPTTNNSDTHPTSVESSETCELEDAFLDLWRTIQASHYDLGNLPTGFASKPILQKPALTRLLDLVRQQKAPDIREAIEEALSITTPNLGIALQMWWPQVAWLKRSLTDCVEFDWKATDINRRPIALEELLAHFQTRLLNSPPTAQ